MQTINLIALLNIRHCIVLAVFGDTFTKKKAHNNSISFPKYSRLHKGGAGVNTAEFVSTCVHVVVVTPTNSKPESQL